MRLALDVLLVVGLSGLALALLGAVFIGLCVVLDRFVGLGRDEDLDDMERHRRHP